jgi:pyridoxamine 5'-phosphate oxidase
MTLLADRLPETLPADPLPLAASWLADAWSRRDQPNPNAMTLATVDAAGRPSARIVLCKDIVADAGYVPFYSNYHSRKGRELADNPRAAIVLHWDHQHRQIRMEGSVLTAPGSDSDAYFASRPWQRRIGAWASAQSEPVDSYAALQRAVEATAQRFGTAVPGPERNTAEPGVTIPRPPHWGGYRLWIDAVELWVEGESRIHDRARWQRELLAVGEMHSRFGPWTATRLQP